MSQSATDLQTIPGVGPSIAVDLRDLGFSSVEQLTGHDPDGMFQDLCELRGASIDPCVKYVFRCAVYFASNEVHEPALLQWWNWKDRTDGWDPRARATRATPRGRPVGNRSKFSLPGG